MGSLTLPATAAMGATWLPYFLVYWLVALTAYQVLMTFVYSRSRSLLVAMLMHASYTGWQFTFWPATSGQQSFIWQGVLAIAMVTVVAAVARHKRVTLAYRDLVPTDEGT